MSSIMVIIVLIISILSVFLIFNAKTNNCKECVPYCDIVIIIDVYLVHPSWFLAHLPKPWECPEQEQWDRLFLFYLVLSPQFLKSL